MKLSIITFTSCIILNNDAILNERKYKLINQLDYIKIIYNINELEKNVIYLKNKKNKFNLKLIYNNFIV